MDLTLSDSDDDAPPPPKKRMAAAAAASEGKWQSTAVGDTKIKLSCGCQRVAGSATGVTHGGAGGSGACWGGRLLLGLAAGSSGGMQWVVGEIGGDYAVVHAVRCEFSLALGDLNFEQGSRTTKMFQISLCNDNSPDLFHLFCFASFIGVIPLAFWPCSTLVVSAVHECALARDQLIMSGPDMITTVWPRHHDSPGSPRQSGL